MKISCQSCQAKYTIADEKVVGKIVKIRCKKCGATIVINGNEPEAATQAHDVAQQGGAPGGGGVYDYTAQQGGEPWTVNVSDGDQRSMTSAEIVAAFHGGTVNDDTYCWRDGMADWLPLREVPELHAACTAGPQPTMNPDVGGYDQQQQHQPQQQQEQPQQAGFSSLFGAPMGQQQQQPQNGGASLFGGGSGSSPPAAAVPAAARRAGGRGGGGADLFGGIAQAGGEQDVMTSAAANPQPVQDDKLTGARNENSVLFSLAALTSSAPEKKDPSPMGGSEGSGLIDIRALSATMEQKKDGNRKVDDIMNLSGGGAFSAALAAPVLAPAPADVADYGGGGGEPRKSNATLMIGIIAGFVIVGVLVAGGVFLAMSKNNASSVATNATTTAPTTTTASTGTDPAATGGGSQAGDPNAGATTAVKPGVGAVGGGGGGGTTAAGGGGGGGHTQVAAGGGGGGGNNAVIPPTTGGGGGGGGKCAPGDLQCAMAQGAGGGGGATTAAAGGGGGSSPFNPGNAMASLGPIASSVGSCKRADGPTGSGHAKITFQPSGTVSSVEIDSGPFPGTAVGGCVAGKFRAAHVPPFSGGAVTVGKGFSI